MGIALFHHHPYTGRACNCRYGRPKFLGPGARLAGVNWNRALKQQATGKKFMALPGAQAFTGWVNELMLNDPEGYRDEIAPLLVKEFRAGRLTFNENRQAYFHRPTPARLTDMMVDRYGQWAAARQHPTRRGVNITGPDFTFASLVERERAYEEDMRERAAHQRKVEAMRESTAPVVHDYGDGWTVRDLAQADHHREEMELEGDIMEHCIGNDGEHPHASCDYKDAVDRGYIPHVYSVRDPEGLPHATFHFNEDGSLAEVHGFRNQSDALTKYAPRVTNFLRERHPNTLAHDADQLTADDVRNGHYPWMKVGNTWVPDHDDEEEDNPYEAEYRVQPATTMEELRRDLDQRRAAAQADEDEYSGRVDPDYFQAHLDGHAPGLDFASPDWHSIANDVRASHGRGGEHRDRARDFTNLLRDQGIDFNLNNAVSQAEADAAFAPLRNDLPIWEREHQLEKAVAEMFPGAAHPSPLFHMNPDRYRYDEDRGTTVFNPLDERSYSYPVTHPDLPQFDGREQYLYPDSKQQFLHQAVKERIKAQRAQGATWGDIRSAEGLGGYRQPNHPAQRALDELSQEEYEENRRAYRQYRRNAQNLQEAHAEGDTFEPYTMEELNNQARQMHWQDLLNGGLTPDQASQRVLEHDRRVRNNPQHCNECGDFGGYHALDCPADPRTQAPQQPQLGRPGTFSRVAAYPDYLFHVSPASNREAIRQEGLRAHETGFPMYNPTNFNRGIPGNYLFDNYQDAVEYAHGHAQPEWHYGEQVHPAKAMDIWRVHQPEQMYIQQDHEPFLFGEHDKQDLHPAQFEEPDDASEFPPHHRDWYWWRDQPEGWDEEDGEFADSYDNIPTSRPITYMTRDHVPPHLLEHVDTRRADEPGWKEDDMGLTYNPDHRNDHQAPLPYHQVQYRDGEDYQRSVHDFLKDKRRFGWTDTDPADAAQWS